MRIQNVDIAKNAKHFGEFWNIQKVEVMKQNIVHKQEQRNYLVGMRQEQAKNWKRQLQGVEWKRGGEDGNKGQHYLVANTLSFTQYSVHHTANQHMNWSAQCKSQVLWKLQTCSVIHSLKSWLWLFSFIYLYFLLSYYFYFIIIFNYFFTCMTIAYSHCYYYYYIYSAISLKSLTFLQWLDELLLWNKISHKHHFVCLMTD